MCVGGGEGVKTTCSQRLNNACFYNCSSGYRTCSFQYQLNSLGNIEHMAYTDYIIMSLTVIDVAVPGDC